MPETRLNAIGGSRRSKDVRGLFYVDAQFARHFTGKRHSGGQLPANDRKHAAHTVFTMVVNDVPAGDRSHLLTGAVGQWTNPGEAVTDIGTGKPGVRKKVGEALKKIFNVVCRRLSIVRIAGISHFGCARQYLSIPGDYEERPSIHRLCVDARAGNTMKLRQDNVRAADSADHLRRRQPGSLGHQINPRPGGVYNLVRYDLKFLSGQHIAQPGAGYPPVAHQHLQKPGIVARGRACGYGFSEPLGDEALGKFALRIFVRKNRPRTPGIELPLQFIVGSDLALSSGPTVVEP